MINDRIFQGKGDLISVLFLKILLNQEDIQCVLQYVLYALHGIYTAVTP